MLTPIAAVCLTVLMAGAVATHRRFRENFVAAVIVALLCLGIAVGHVQLLRSHGAAEEFEYQGRVIVGVIGFKKATAAYALELTQR